MAIKSISYDLNHAMKIAFADYPDVLFEDTKSHQQCMFPFPLANPKYSSTNFCRFSAIDNELSFQRCLPQLYATLTARDGLGTITLKVSNEGQGATHTFSNVEKLIIRGSKINVYINGDASNPGTVSNSFDRLWKPAPAAPVSTFVSPAMEAANEKIRALENTIEQLRKDNDRLQAEKNAMEYAINQAVTDQLPIESDNLRQLSQKLQDSMNEFTKIRTEELKLADEINHTIDQIQQAQQRRDEALEKKRTLQEQLANAHIQEESAELDCAQTARELEALKIRLAMNGNVIELSESRWLKNNSVRDTMKELEHKITAVENRICLIINARELYNQNVQGAVMRENDGTVSMDAENTSAAQEPDTSDHMI